MSECRFYCKDENINYFVVSDCDTCARIAIRSGGNKPFIIMSEKFLKGVWHIESVYKPDFCPGCGRKLEVLQ